MNKPATSKQLNETMAKKFGTKIDVASFTLEQLQDARNKIRSKVFDIETNESFGGLSHNKTYSKNKLFLDVLNTAIGERADIQDAPLEEAQSAAQKAAFQKMLDKKSGKDQKTKPEDKATKADSKPKDGKMPMDDNGTPGDKSDDKPAFLKKKNESKHIDEGKDIINNYYASLLKEGEEDKAELVMASKDMVDRLTGWMEDTAEMQTESMLELADAIRDEMGAQQSEAFTMAVKPALEQLYASMETTRIALTTGVGMLTGEGEAPPMDMGAEAPVDDVAMEPTDDMDMEADLEVGDEFGAAAPAAGGDDEAGRAKRESRMQKKKMIETSRRLGSILSKPGK
tara:strand:+ start:1423 stop:2445 length:1023 start_codon:yes stop_codon:yes gene_type:complete